MLPRNQLIHRKTQGPLQFIPILSANLHISLPIEGIGKYRTVCYIKLSVFWKNEALCAGERWTFKTVIVNLLPKVFFKTRHSLIA